MRKPKPPVLFGKPMYEYCFAPKEKTWELKEGDITAQVVLHERNNDENGYVASLIIGLRTVWESEKLATRAEALRALRAFFERTLRRLNRLKNSPAPCEDCE